MCDLGDMHAYIDDLMGKPEWVLGAGDTLLPHFDMDTFKHAARPDFIAAIEEAKRLIA